MNQQKLLYSLIIISIISVQVLADEDENCGGEETEDSCTSKKRALPLKLIAIATILGTSVIGVCFPLLTTSIAALSPDRNAFVIVKAFASGIILGTGFMHVLPDSFDNLSSNCLKEHPWHQFPFSGFVAMLSTVMTMFISSMTTSMQSRKKVESGGTQLTHVVVGDEEMSIGEGDHSHSHGAASQLLRYKVIAMVLELGILVHSVIIGLSLGASNNTCAIKGLIAALCFHQMFEGMGLGSCILQAKYSLIKRATMAFFFSVTTPCGIALGLAVSSTYKENSPQSLIVEGLLNAASAGLLIYMALVDLLASDFMGAKLQKNVKLQIVAYMAVLLGAGGMSVMAIWA